MKNRILTPITQIAAALVLAGSLFTATADDRQKSDDPRKARYLAAQRELSAAVKAGKVSEADAKRRLSRLAQMLWKKDEAQDSKSGPSKQTSERLAKYRHAHHEIMAAVKAGKISEAEAKKKLAAVKKALSGQGKSDHGKREHDKREHGNERMAKYKAIEREIYGAVKAGKMSKEDAHKKLAHIKGQIFGKGGHGHSHGKSDQPKRISREQAMKMNREIMEAGKAGKLSREEAHKKFQAIRSMMAGPQHPQSDRAPRTQQSRPGHHHQRKPATTDKRGSDRNLAAEIDALRREVHGLKRTLEAIRRDRERRER